MADENEETEGPNLDILNIYMPGQQLVMGTAENNLTNWGSENLTLYPLWEYRGSGPSPTYYYMQYVFSNDTASLTLDRQGEAVLSFTNGDNPVKYAGTYHLLASLDSISKIGDYVAGLLTIDSKNLLFRVVQCLSINNEVESLYYNFIINGYKLEGTALVSAGNESITLTGGGNA